VKDNIEVGYDFRLDTKCGDPDTDSLKLYNFHSLLWNQKVANNKTLNLQVLNKNYGRLILKTNLTDNLSSDRMFPHFIGKYNGKLDSWLSDSDKEKLQYKVRTIGGHIVFPAHRKNGFTINQARGVNRKISDRFDLTLECIKRFYQNEESPLSSTLCRYSEFFRVFENFENYIEFFMLQDFIKCNGEINYALPFDDFNRSALPKSKKEYGDYMNITVELIDKRNKRIFKRIKNIVYV